MAALPSFPKCAGAITAVWESTFKRIRSSADNLSQAPQRLRTPGQGRGYRRCRCPVWVDGFFAGEEVRKSLCTADWQKAQDLVRGMEATNNEPKSIPEPLTIQLSRDRFLADAKARQLNESTIYKYRLLFKQIRDFAERRGLRYLKELDLPMLDEFRSEWKDGPRSSLKKLERLRAFLRFCERRKWIHDPAIDLKAPKVQDRPTMPFTQAEMLKILAAGTRIGSGIPSP